MAVPVALMEQALLLSGSKALASILQPKVRIASSIGKRWPISRPLTVALLMGACQDQLTIFKVILFGSQSGMASHQLLGFTLPAPVAHFILEN